MEASDVDVGPAEASATSLEGEPFDAFPFPASEYAFVAIVE